MNAPRVPSDVPLFTVAICTGREEEEAFFWRWVSMRQAVEANAPEVATLSPRLRELLISCVSYKDSTFLLPQLRSLSLQTFRNFEVIVVDCALGNRRPYEAPHGIPVFRAVPPRDTPWLHEPWPDRYDAAAQLWDVTWPDGREHGNSPWVHRAWDGPDRYEPCPLHWQVKWPIGAAARNTAIVHARGQRLVFLDDCTLIEPWYLATMVEHLDRGVFPVSPRALPFLWPDHGVGDYRAFSWCPLEDTTKVESSGLAPTTSLRHAGTSFPLAGWLAVNGYDETYDPVLSLEDIDVQGRLGRWPGTLQWKGKALDPCCDGMLPTWELGHFHFHAMRYAVRHNGILDSMISQRWPGRARANDERPDAAFWQELKARHSEPGINCGFTPNCDVTAPPFDLTEERRALGMWVP